MIWKRLIIIGLILAAIGGAVGAYLWFKPVRSIQDAKVDYKISAVQLFDEYSSDEASADSLYRRAILEVSGTVIDVKEEEKEIDGETKTLFNVVLDGGDMMFGVICQMEDPDLDKLRSISPGSEVTIKGECSGMLMDVVLSRCYFVKQ